MSNSQFSIISIYRTKYLRVYDNKTSHLSLSTMYLPLSTINNDIIVSLLIDDYQLYDIKYFNTNVVCINNMKQISTYLNFEIHPPTNNSNIPKINQILKINFKLKKEFIISNLV